MVTLTSYIVVKSSNKTSELVCEIRGYEQLLNCWFQITTFICLLVFFIFLFFCGISTFVSYNYIKLTKSSIICQVFFKIFLSHRFKHNLKYFSPGLSE
jgi:hypothetical protein